MDIKRYKDTIVGTALVLMMWLRVMFIQVILLWCFVFDTTLGVFTRGDSFPGGKYGAGALMAFAAWQIIKYIRLLRRSDGYLIAKAVLIFNKLRKHK